MPDLERTILACPRCGDLLPQGMTGMCGFCMETAAVTAAAGLPWHMANRLLCDALHRGVLPPADPTLTRDLDAILELCPITPDSPPPLEWVL